MRRYLRKSLVLVIALFQLTTQLSLTIRLDCNYRTTFR